MACQWQSRPHFHSLKLILVESRVFSLVDFKVGISFTTRRVLSFLSRRTRKMEAEAGRRWGFGVASLGRRGFLQLPRRGAARRRASWAEWAAQVWGAPPKCMSVPIYMLYMLYTHVHIYIYMLVYIYICIGLCVCCCCCC